MNSKTQKVVKCSVNNKHWQRLEPDRTFHHLRSLKVAICFVMKYKNVDWQISKLFKLLNVRSGDAVPSISFKKSDHTIFLSFFLPFFLSFFYLDNREAFFANPILIFWQGRNSRLQSTWGINPRPLFSFANCLAQNYTCSFIDFLPASEAPGDSSISMLNLK